MRSYVLVFSLAFLLALPAAAANITVTAPAASAHWVIGSHQFITWTYSGFADSKKIVILLFQNGTKIGTIAEQPSAGTNGQGSYEWPSGATIELAAPAGSGYAVRVKTADGIAVGNSGSFTLDPKPPLVINKTKLTPFNPNTTVTVPNVQSINVTSPNAGTPANPYSTVYVKWDKLGAQDANVAVTLLKGGAAVATLAASTPNIGNFTWSVVQVPPSPLDPGLYAIKVRTLDGKVEGTSPEFTMKESGGIELTSPLGGEVWESGYPHPVKWKRLGNIQKLDIFLERQTMAPKILAQGVDAKLLTKTVTFVRDSGDGTSVLCYKVQIKHSGGNTVQPSGCITLTGNPDLVAVDAHISPGIINMGTDVTFTVTVKNQGLIESHPCQGNLKFNGAVKSTFSIPNIGAGQSLKIDAHLIYSGSGTVVITLDSSGNNVEPDKANNVWTKVIG